MEDPQPALSAQAAQVAARQQPQLLITAVYIDLQQAVALTDNGRSVALTDVPAGRYNLLQANPGAALFRTAQLPARDIKGLRLILGANSSIQLSDGSIHALDTPSGTTSGLKVQLDQAVNVANTTHQVRVPFSTDRDIVRRGNESFGLKPVLKGILNTVSVSPGT
ncbi:DUF4382 domain-containing protein [Hymenobacter puniceus]|uniref:DUF4382 domain-containing protein n=1 Tax=Hymenobacter sp. BT190 TaxID=2763505 RepID=UPI00165123AD|nr:DUF4382 domain-containing protein [Hymenobacter sp. BT190]